MPAPAHPPGDLRQGSQWKRIVNTETYAAEQLPITPLILGTPLKPFTLGHAVMLARLGSPFAPGMEQVQAPGIGDLLLALEVCRREPFHRPSVLRLRWLQLSHARLGAAELVTSCSAFANYVRSAFRVPAYWHKAEAEDEDSGVPTVLALKLGLMSRLHRSEAEALQTPVALALLELVSLRALEGWLEMVTEEDRRMMQEARGLKLAEANAAGNVPKTDRGDVLPLEPMPPAATTQAGPPASTPDPPPAGTIPPAAPPDRLS